MSPEHRTCLLHCPRAQLRLPLGSVRLELVWDLTTSELDYQVWGGAQDSWLPLLIPAPPPPLSEVLSRLLLYSRVRLGKIPGIFP